MARQASNVPTKKVGLGAATGALTAIIIWALNTFDVLPAGTDIPGDIGAAITTVLTFVVSYFVPPSKNDAVVES